jgi:16S rRNA (guanine966-N2)-methyltransferase
MLASRLGSFEGLGVADLFAGSGALGLEALSRGASHCTFIENNRSAIDCLRTNVAKLGATERCDVRAQAVEHAPAPASPFDLILMDPPYATGQAQTAIDRIAQDGWLSPGGWLSVETSRESLVLPAGYQLLAERRFGKATINLIQNDAER